MTVTLMVLPSLGTNKALSASVLFLMQVSQAVNVRTIYVIQNFHSFFDPFVVLKEKTIKLLAESFH